jgi:hypothetical protein
MLVGQAHHTAHVQCDKHTGEIKLKYLEKNPTHCHHKSHMKFPETESGPLP